MSKNKKKKKKPIKAQVVSASLEEKKKFVCLRCGFCCICSTPAFTREEYKKVRDLKITRERNVKFTKVKFGTLVSRFNKRVALQEYAYFTQKGVDTLKLGTGCKNPPPCEFLDKDDDGKYFCAIYPYRPSVCRDFGVKEWHCPNNPNYLKKATKGCCLFLFKKTSGDFTTFNLFEGLINLFNFYVYLVTLFYGFDYNVACGWAPIVFNEGGFVFGGLLFIYLIRFESDGYEENGIDFYLTRYKCTGRKRKLVIVGEPFCGSRSGARIQFKARRICILLLLFCFNCLFIFI